MSKQAGEVCLDRDEAQRLRLNYLANRKKQIAAGRRRIMERCTGLQLSENPTAEEKNYVRSLTSQAVRYGILKRLVCQVCGSIYSECHHTDYRRPLSVEWLCIRHHKEKHRNEDVSQAEAITLAIKIAKSETRGRNYRDDVIGDVLLAVASGKTTREGIEQACRKSIRREWARSERFVSNDDADLSSDDPPRTFPGLWEAIKVLKPKHYQAITLYYWGGLTQGEISREMRVTQQFVSILLRESENQIKNILATTCKTGAFDAVSK